MRNVLDKSNRENQNTHSNCMLDTLGYRYTLRICNNYWFSTPTMISQTCLIVMCL